MKKLFLISIIIISLSVFACTDAQRAKIGGLGDRHKIELYSGGVKIGEWISPGKVGSEEQSDGYYFQDEKTGLLMEVSGDVIITRLSR